MYSGSLISGFVIHFMESMSPIDIRKLFNILVSVAEQNGSLRANFNLSFSEAEQTRSSLTLSDTPRQGVLASMSIWDKN